MADSPPPIATVKSAMRTLDILEYVVAHGRPLVAQEIAGALLIPVSSLSYLLTTLVERGYLVREGRRYLAGPRLERLHARAPGFSLAERAAPLVRALRVQLNETASFFVRREWECEAVVTETSDHALRYAVQTGRRVPLHGFAAGKALLSALPEDELERYFAETERVRFTPTTICSEAGLRAEIFAIRQTGFAHTREEHTPGIHGVARLAMVDDEPIGAFSFAIPIVRYDEASEAKAAALLQRITDLIAAS
ncbi:IclR family transcriptional regulator [Sphingomonas spermidinifaciens]|uniref:IclR family transcriptional regulator n=1 Tax=Sphingomonas spermidinifaciens TaxID=1141889 RepID=A0A2A4B583_9SPHN|nr:IclR family transcriptional regulator [Sphingomonas spermidinifaciens]PCD03240.1 IclR family transcriptional regulator [Sphingomonas spermidinifaciens]